jgi:hypothetical protein
MPDYHGNVPVTRKTGKPVRDVWNEALRLRRVGYKTEVLKAEGDKD